MTKMLLSGNEAIARAARDCGVTCGSGYPGTPSSEILETFSALGGAAEWSPNEKAALETGIGSAYARARVLVTMKHVGLNVAADPLFTISAPGLPGELVIVSADDPGMASSQNEQDNRRYAVAAGVPMLEPADQQDCYDLLFKAYEIAREYHTAVLFRVTTRVCHSKGVVTLREEPLPPPAVSYEKNVASSVMIPAYARIAHRTQAARLEALSGLADRSARVLRDNDGPGGIIATGVSALHALEAAPDRALLHCPMSYPFPVEAAREFVRRHPDCTVVEEGENILADALLAAGVPVKAKAGEFRFGELNVNRVRKLLAGDTTPEPAVSGGKPPALCPGCPHRKSYEALKAVGAIVSGDIGCYTLGVMPPFESVDISVCMGASITVGLGLRRVLPEERARKVVSVIGDSTFWHTGINGIVEMLYNTPATGHIVMILDNSTTAMTGLQEHPGTGRRLDHTPVPALNIENTLRGMGVAKVAVIDPLTEFDKLVATLREFMAGSEPSAIISRRSCLLAAAKQKKAREAAK